MEILPYLKGKLLLMSKMAMMTTLEKTNVELKYDFQTQREKDIKQTQKK